MGWAPQGLQRVMAQHALCAPLFGCQAGVKERTPRQVPGGKCRSCQGRDEDPRTGSALPEGTDGWWQPSDGTPICLAPESGHLQTQDPECLLQRREDPIAEVRCKQREPSSRRPWGPSATVGTKPYAPRSHSGTRKYQK